MQILLFLLPLLALMSKCYIKSRRPGTIMLPAKSMKKKKVLQLLFALYR